MWYFTLTGFPWTGTPSSSSCALGSLCPEPNTWGWHRLEMLPHRCDQRRVFFHRLVEQHFRYDQVKHLAGEEEKCLEFSNLPDCIEEHRKEQAFSKIEEIFLLDCWTRNKSPAEERLRWRLRWRWPGLTERGGGGVEGRSGGRKRWVCRDCGRRGCSATSLLPTPEFPSTEHSWPDWVVVRSVREIYTQGFAYFEPKHVLGVYWCLDNDTEVHEIAEVQHEEVVLLSVVVLKPDKSHLKQTLQLRLEGLEEYLTCMPWGRP